MTQLSFRLFGKFAVLANGEPVQDFGPGKARELLAYLLVYRDRPHPREKLAEVLWQASSSATAKKYLRQALWQMQQALPLAGLVENQTDWIRITAEAGFRSDLAGFELAFSHARGIPGQQLEPAVAARLERAIAAYRGDLLEGWYSDWCIFERERLQNNWLAMLDKLMSYCELRQDYEAGLAHGMRALRNDPARERTHRRMMRMAYLAGDRTGALRQYQRCAEALQEELGVGPGRRTAELFRLIQQDTLETARALPTPGPVDPVSDRVRRLRSLLTEFRDRINQDIDSLGQALGDPK